MTMRCETDPAYMYGHFWYKIEMLKGRLFTDINAHYNNSRRFLVYESNIVPKVSKVNQNYCPFNQNFNEK